MTRLSFKFLLHLTSLLISLTLSLSTPTTTNDLVQATCSNTPDPALCESELRSDPRSSKADSEGLILIMIDVVKSRFSDSLRIAQDLTRKTHDRDTIRALNNCVELYRVVLDYNIGEAINAVKQGDPKFGEEAMVDSGNEAEACHSGFPHGKVPTQLSGRTKTLHGVSNVAASLIKTLE